MSNMTATAHMSQHLPDHANTPVCLVTGCSTGFGRSLANHLLSRSYRTVVSARDISQIADFAKYPSALLLQLDVTEQAQVDAAVATTMARFGRIDYLINNAGIGYFAAVEESEAAQVRRMFEVNFFGASRMIQAVLPSMREKRSGFIVNISSIGGLCAFPALGYYNASKFALEGLSEALWQEVEPLGIQVMLVEPSGFRTDWAGRSAADSTRQIADYAASAGACRQHLRAISGLQAGDPERAAQVIVHAMEARHPPHRLLLGADAVQAAMQKLEVMREEFSKWQAVARSADLPPETTASSSL